MSSHLGFHAVITAQEEQGTALAELLLAAADVLKANDQCELYLIHQSAVAADQIHVTELWRDQASHKASLALPLVRALIEQARPLILNIQGALLKLLGGKRRDFSLKDARFRRSRV